MNKDNFFHVFDLVDKYRPKGINAFWIIGGRNTGKTFNCEKDMLDRGLFQFYLRRTGKQLKLAMRGNIFNKLIELYPEYDGHYSEYNEDLSTIYDKDDNLIGYGGSLTTMDNMTGADFSLVDVFFWDEFIRKKNERKMIDDELESFFWAYDTIARLRELEGKEPLLFIGCSNANTITNDIFIGYGIVSKLEECIKKGQDLYIDWERGFLVMMLETPEELLEARKKTAIARMSKGTSYYDLSLNNDFADDDFNFVRKLSIKGFKPLCQVNTWYIWEKKNDTLIYITYHKANIKEFYNLDIDVDKIAFVRSYPWLTSYYEQKRIRFESIELKEKFLDLFKFKK